MNRLLDPESWPIRVLTRICDFILLNLMLSFFCFTVIFSGAAVLALYSVTLKMVRDEEGETVKGFLRALKDNFISSVPATILLFVDVTLMAILYYALYADTLVFSPFVFIALCIAAVFLTAFLSYLFPLLARFENTFGKHLGNAIRLALVNLPVTFLLATVNLLPALSVFLFSNGMKVFAPFWLFIGAAAGAYLNSFYLRRIFEDTLENNKSN